MEIHASTKYQTSEIYVYAAFICDIKIMKCVSTFLSAFLFKKNSF